MELQRDIESIIFNEQFKISQSQKETILLDIIKRQLDLNKKNLNIASMYRKFNVDISAIEKLYQVPFIPVNMFKKFDLVTCNKKDLIRILNSSSTTSGIPSKIYLDRITSIRQSQALVSTLKNFLGGKRRPLLVLDAESSNRSGQVLSARGAAIRGVSNFASSITYAMDEENDDLVINMPRLRKFQDENTKNEILVYGFTYIIWSKFVRKLEKNNMNLSLPNMKLLHSGGWKKLVSQRVEKDEFNERTSKIFGTAKQNIMDFYGMVEQLGVVFVDCEYGYKHIPDFADVIIRDFNTLKEVKPGQSGIIEVMSILGSSYPSQGILTEDVGQLVGIDDCKCGRQGKYFRFRSRMEKSEVRGCGDTFAEEDVK